MTSPRTAIVIGAGFGGLALAIRLQSAGIATTLIEGRDKPGGRAYYWEREGFTFPLLADFWPHGQVAKEYGVFLEDKGFANRATFLIDRDGIIQASFITAPGEARSLDAYRAALETLPATV